MWRIVIYTTFYFTLNSPLDVETDIEIVEFEDELLVLEEKLEEVLMTLATSEMK